MKDQIRQLVDQGIGIGDIVRINSGPYRNITATVLEEIPENRTVQVSVKLRSKESIVTLPRSFLVVVERAPLSSVSNRLTAILDWTNQVRPVYAWKGDISPLYRSFEQYQQLEFWNQRGFDLVSIVNFGGGMQKGVDPLAKVRTRLSELSGLDDWFERFRLLYTFVTSYRNGGLKADQLDNLHGKLVELVWLEDLLERIRLLWEDVDGISRALARRQEGKTMVQNVLVDGHNLAFRCLYAPGISDLRDSKGRPTGLILGFLRSLGSLKKRFPDARVHVVWDGSSRRRKKKFADYKANRDSHRESMPPEEVPSGIRFDPIRILKDILPLFGIHQAWNPEEEADDVIATLTRKEFSRQNNVVFSTDKDLLQLVNGNTSLLVPAVGSRNEILFDSATVVKTIGVPSEKMVQLRAFYGDPSDNIPGVPRVPKKVLRSLVQAHGSVEAVYRSGLTGLTKGQYERLRSAEPQVRINVELMTLVDVGVTSVPPDVDPDNVAARLRELDIEPTSLLDIFFGSGHR
jgi:5'-3' exonuclease